MSDRPDDLGLLARLEREWMTGRSTPLTSSQVPADWWSHLQTSESAELDALALMSQYRVFHDHFVPSDPQPLATLPELELPRLEPSLRPLCRRCLPMSMKGISYATTHLLELLAHRQRSIHPADWLPQSENEQLPELYSPWLAWLSATQSGGSDSTPLDEKTWEHHSAADKLRRLRLLRREDAARARDLIAAQLANESADQRYGMIEVLGHELTEADSPLLKSLHNDRSGRVRALAERLLARLGENDSNQVSEQAATLAKDFEVKHSGLIRKSIRVSPVKLSSAAKKDSRTYRLQTIKLADLARALSLSEAELAEAWDFNQHRDSDNRAFLIAAASSAPLDLIQALVSRVFEQHASEESLVSCIRILSSRLSQAERNALTVRLLLLDAPWLSLGGALSMASYPLEISWAHYRDTASGAELHQLLSKNLADEGRITSPRILLDLAAAGLLLPANEAEACLEFMQTVGINAADPVLDLLKLNVQLTPLPAKDIPT